MGSHSNYCAMDLVNNMLTDVKYFDINILLFIIAKLNYKL